MLVISLNWESIALQIGRRFAGPENASPACVFQHTVKACLRQEGSPGASGFVREVVMSRSFGISARRLAANRRNARHSTGPRTRAGKRNSAMNRLRHGLYVTSLGPSLRSLGEDPAEFERLVERMLEEWKPATATGERLVRQLACLMWKYERLDRAERGTAARRLETLELARARLATQERALAPAAEPGSGGFYGLADSTAKFEGLLGTLREALMLVRRREGTDQLELLLKRLYGKHYTPSGLHPKDEPEARETERFFLEEIRKAEEDFALYKRAQVDVSPALRDSLLANPWSDALLARRESSLVRQMERMVKLLFLLRRPLNALRAKRKAV
jgi:hypothetical protein